MQCGIKTKRDPCYSGQLEGVLEHVALSGMGAVLLLLLSGHMHGRMMLDLQFFSQTTSTKHLALLQG